MAGGIPISAKFDVAIAEPFDSKLESVLTFSDLANTPFPYKGMQKLVEDEGGNGIVYILGDDLTTWTASVLPSSYAQTTLGGTLKARLDGSVLYLTNDGTDA
jgi:hypothetical protein